MLFWRWVSRCSTKQIETRLTPLGATAIEDMLQDHVKDTVAVTVRAMRHA